MATLPSQLLAAQHREIDVGVRGALDDRGKAAELAAALATLRQHLYVEEAALFPPLVTAGLAMPVFVMKREHGEMWPLLETLTAACAEARPLDPLHETCRHLFQLLQIHNPKEEEIVYSAADRIAATDPKLAQAIEAARMPDGWTCAMAPRAGAAGGPARQPLPFAAPK